VTKETRLDKHVKDSKAASKARLATQKEAQKILVAITTNPSDMKPVKELLKGRDNEIATLKKKLKLQD